VKRRAPTLADERDSAVLSKPDYYACTAFRGRDRGGYECVSCSTVAEARGQARAMYVDRPVAIYAIKDGRQVYLESVGR
jgi:hypothetical protein